MIILYIPFNRTQAGNLADEAKVWINNHSLYSTEEIQVIHHGDNLNDDLLEKNITVFVLAHGAKADPTMVANLTDPATATIISTETLAERFNYDFLFIATRLESIHLYCCGQEQKNAVLAKTFEKALLLLDSGEIKYYDGVIFTPDQKGYHWSTSYTGTQQLAIAKTHRFFRMHPSDSNDSNRGIKSMVLAQYQQNCKARRIDCAQQYRDSIKRETIHAMRHTENMEIEPISPMVI